jgi:membrane associated rhomboid family serine protease
MIPLRTSISPKHTPYANYLLIAANVIVFLLSYHPNKVFSPEHGGYVLEPLRSWAQQFMLAPARPYIWQFVTYAFLHGSWMHIIGNLYFLYIFGNNVNDRLGNVGYLCFYFGGAVFSGLGHALISSNPVLGASGAVAAVTGAYLVLFPNTVITVLMMFFYFWDTIEIRALYFIAFKLIFWDNILEPRFSNQPVAYDAHLAGFLFGIVALLLLLAVRLLDSSQNDLLFLFRQWNRRRMYRDTVSDGYDPHGAGRVARPVTATVIDTADPAVALCRERIAAAIAGKNITEAAQAYAKLLESSPEQTLGRQNQLDVANQLMSLGLWEAAAQAYENFLSHYASYEYLSQVQLMLGLLYTRYIKKTDRAGQLLNAARPRLSQPGQIRMCDDLLKELSM